ncbi:MAG: fructose-bisphosphate aldolase class I [Planctomycetota bacterium]|nr:fructose-bisphosphate aldolase class I [Planctomycetota bacterium]
MDQQQLERTARALVAPNKGILAADESTGTIKKRFDSIGVESTAASRIGYRETFFTAKGANENISGVILYDETLRQNIGDGRSVPKALMGVGILPGIKVDTGAKPLVGHPGESITEGLDGLLDRCQEYYKIGARFAKWRAVYKIFDGKPSHACIHANAHALARYAAIAQEAGLVPIVEPEVLMDGDHTIEAYEAVSGWAWAEVFRELCYLNVHLEGILLKPNMVLSGTTCPTQASVSDVAEATVRLLRRVVPPAVPGIVFLSGGQSDVRATEHLNAMNQLGPHPWELSYSYGRALQAPALKAWAGSAANAPVAQAAFLHRARCNGAARTGTYTPAMEAAPARA